MDGDKSLTNPGPYKFKTKVIISSTDTSERNAYYEAEGGALNSGYKDFDVGCIVANDLGLKGYTYGKDFYFEDAGLDCVVFSCNDEKIKSYLTLRFKCVDQEESLFA